MALILGHSQLKYFKNYVEDPSIQCFFSSGCTVEDLVTFPGVKEAIPAAKVINIFSLFLCLSILFIFTKLKVTTHTHARTPSEFASR